MFAKPADQFGADEGDLSAGHAFATMTPEPIDPTSHCFDLDNILFNPESANQVYPLTLDRMVREVSMEATRSRAGVLIYVHGYWNSLDRSVSAAAAIARNIAFGGPVIAFSWPSQDSPDAYSADKEIVPYSSFAFARLIRELAHANVPIYVVAHSAGSTTAIMGLYQLLVSDAAQVKPIRQVVLAAPDFNVERFEKFYLAMSEKMGFQTTVYFSRDDRAIWAAMKVTDGKLRLGRDPDTVMGRSAAIEFVDVAEAAATEVTRHRYLFVSKPVLRDLSRILLSGESAAQRGLDIAGEGGLRHYKLPTLVSQGRPAQK